MTIDELREEAAKLTPPPGHPMFRTAGGEPCFAVGRQDALFGYYWPLSAINEHDLLKALCVGAHGWIIAEQNAQIDWAISIAEKNYEKWQRLADAAYELLTKGD